MILQSTTSRFSRTYFMFLLAICLVTSGCKVSTSEKLIGKWLLTNVEKASEDGWTIYPPLSAGNQDSFSPYFKQINNGSIAFKKNDKASTNLFSNSQSDATWNFIESSNELQMRVSTDQKITNQTSKRYFEVSAIVKEISDQNLILIFQSKTRLTFKKI